MSRLDPRIGLLLEVLDQAFDHQAWHGTTLAGAVRGVSLRDALWRPSPRRHNIWELVLHTAYWKYVVARRLIASPRGQFPRQPSNWPKIPDPADGPAWKRDVRLLHDQHAALRHAIAAFAPPRLAARGKSRWTPGELIHGIAAHDLYHTGQIQLLKRLARASDARTLLAAPKTSPQ